MRKRRQRHGDHNLTNGPGKLCIAMGIDRKLDAADLLGNRVWLEEGRTVPAIQHCVWSTNWYRLRRRMDRQAVAILDSKIIHMSARRRAGELINARKN